MVFSFNDPQIVVRTPLRRTLLRPGFRFAAPVQRLRCIWTWTPTPRGTYAELRAFLGERGDQRSTVPRTQVSIRIEQIVSRQRPQEQLPRSEEECAESMPLRGRLYFGTTPSAMPWSRRPALRVLRTPVGPMESRSSLAASSTKST